MSDRKYERRRMSVEDIHCELTGSLKRAMIDTEVKTPRGMVEQIWKRFAKGFKETPVMDASDREKGKVQCASCGGRRDQHGVKAPCPRFVTPPDMNAKAAPDPFDAGNARIIIHGAPINGLSGDLARLAPAYPGAIIDKTPVSAPDATQALCSKIGALERSMMTEALQLENRLHHAIARIEALEKQIAKTPSFDPRLERAARERPDYTKWIDDEDCLGDDGTRDVPQVKPRVIF